MPDRSVKTASGHAPAKERDQAPAGPSVTYVVARLDRVVRRQIELAIDPFGVTVTQYTVLSALARQPGLSSAQLARRAYVSPQSMNETLLVLEARGLVGRKPDPSRRRVLTTVLTSKGRKLVDACDAEVGTVESAMTEGMSVSERTALRALMVRAVQNLGGGFPERAEK